MAAITDFDQFLIAQGTHRRAYEKLGAHPGSYAGTEGTYFAVWAPDAEAVSVIGDFNHWQPGETPLYPAGDSGIWEGVVAGVGPGALYKYAVRPRGAERWLEKADPYGRAAELRPRTASIVVDLDAYEWHDSAWLDARPHSDWLGSPIAVYEVHLGSWRRDPGQPGRFLT